MTDKKPINVAEINEAIKNTDLVKLEKLINVNKNFLLDNYSIKFNVFSNAFKNPNTDIFKVLSPLIDDNTKLMPLFLLAINYPNKIKSINFLLPFLQKNQENIENAIKFSVHQNDRELIDLLFDKIDVEKMKKVFLSPSATLLTATPEHKNHVLELGVSYFMAKAKVFEDGKCLKDNISQMSSVFKKRAI